MRLKDVVIVSVCRMPIGDFMESLKDVPARDLAIAAGKEAVARANIAPEIIAEIWGTPFTSIVCNLNIL
ncbi:MAG: hypothetical protein KKH04_15620 [Proteobacteria bacterium]|nr:hypothetical protein [Pseudomonadota bacterium]